MCIRDSIQGFEHFDKGDEIPVDRVLSDVSAQDLSLIHI